MASGGDERSVRNFVASSGGEWLVADCAPADVERLRARDHHVVTLNGRRALLLSYHLWSEPPPATPRVFLLFGYTDGHPRAPDDVQRTVERLTFRRD